MSKNWFDAIPERQRLCSCCPKFKELCKQQEQGELDKKKAKLVIKALVSVGRYPLAVEFAKKSHDKKLHREYYKYYQKLVFDKSATNSKILCTDFGCTADEVQECFERAELTEKYSGENFSFRAGRKKGEVLNSPTEMLKFFRSELPKIGILSRWNKANETWCPDTGNFNPNSYLGYLLPSLPVVLTDDTPPQISIYYNGVWTLQRPPMELLKQLFRTHYNRAAPGMWKSSIIRECLDILPQECPSCSTLKSGKNYVNVQNCLVYFRDGEIHSRSHTDEVYTTRQIPVAYDKDCECPNFQHYLSSTFRGDEDLIKVVQEAVGYTLLDTCKAHKMFLLVGPGGNGKSVLLSVMEALLGYAKGTSGLSLDTINNNRFAPYDLIGKFANLSNESEASGKEPTGLKVSRALASGDSIYVEQKGKPGFMTKLTAKQFYCMNEIMPVKNGTSQGNLRRVLIIPFEQVFSMEPVGDELPMDVELIDKLMEELPAILRWALEGAQRLIENNFKFSHSDKVDEYFAIYANAVDQYQMSRFVDEMLIDDPDPNTKESTRKIYEAYRSWCEKNKIEAGKTASENKLSEELIKALTATGKYFAKHGAKQNRVHLFGWRFRTADDIDIDLDADNGEDTKEPSTLEQLMTEIQKWSPKKQQMYLEKLRARKEEQAKKAQKATEKAQQDEEGDEDSSKAEAKPKKAPKAAKKAQQDEEVEDDSSEAEPVAQKPQKAPKKALKAAKKAQPDEEVDDDSRLDEKIKKTIKRAK